MWLMPVPTIRLRVFECDVDDRLGVRPSRELREPSGCIQHAPGVHDDEFRLFIRPSEEGGR
jgi:hypothetical protein